MGGGRAGLMWSRARVARAALMCVALLWAGSTVVAQGEVMTFARAVELARVSSPVAAAETQLELARLALEAALHPVSATASGDARTTTDFTGQGTSVALELGVNATLRTGWGASGDAAAAARRALAAAEAAVDVASFDAVQQAVRYYADGLAAVAARDVALVRLEIARLQAEAARSRLAAGAALEGDVAQAELAYTSAELDLRVAEAAVAAALTNLSLALGVNVTGISDDLPSGTFPAFGLTDDALAARLDVRAARREIEAATDALAQAQRASGVNVSASVSLSGSSGSTSLTLGAGIDTQNRTPSLSGRLSTSTGAPVGPGTSGPAVRATVGVGATVPLGPPDTRVASAEVALAQAEARLDQVVARAGVEVAALSAQVEAGASRLQVAKTRLALALDAAASAQRRYDLGVIGSVEVLQARVAVAQANAELNTAKAGLLQSSMALARAVGVSAERSTDLVLGLEGTEAPR